MPNTENKSTHVIPLFRWLHVVPYIRVLVSAHRLNIMYLQTVGLIFLCLVCITYICVTERCTYIVQQVLCYATINFCEIRDLIYIYIQHAMCTRKYLQTWCCVLLYYQQHRIPICLRDVNLLYVSVIKNVAYGNDMLSFLKTLNGYQYMWLYLSIQNGLNTRKPDIKSKLHNYVHVYVVCRDHAGSKVTTERIGLRNIRLRVFTFLFFCCLVKILHAVCKQRKVCRIRIIYPDCFLSNNVQYVFR